MKGDQDSGLGVHYWVAGDVRPDTHLGQLVRELSTPLSYNSISSSRYLTLLRAPPFHHHSKSPPPSSPFFFFFFNDTATTEIYTLSLHDALPISPPSCSTAPSTRYGSAVSMTWSTRSEEHTSELQSPCNLVCRLLLEKKKK